MIPAASRVNATKSIRPEPLVDMLNVAPEPLPLVLDGEIFVNVDAPVDVPLDTVLTPDEAAVPVADALIAPEIGEFPDAEAAVTLPVKS